MQVMDPHGGNEQIASGRRYWKVLALCLVLTACQAPSTPASAEAAAAPVPLAAAAPAAPPHAVTGDSSRYPDASYTDGRLRPAYGWCVDGVEDAGKLQACGKDELAYQEGRLQEGASKTVTGLDAAAKQAFLATQATWRSDTDRHCSAPTNAGVDDLKAQECRLFRVANRADALMAQSGPPDTSYTQATLRPEFIRCVQQARGMNDHIQACGDTELAYHQTQLQAEVARLMNGPDSPAKDRWMDEQATWAEDTDKRCSPATESVGQALDAQSCLINRYANRAVELQARERR